MAGRLRGHDSAANARRKEIQACRVRRRSLEAPRTEALKAHRSSATSAARRGARMASDHALRGLKVVG